MLKNFLQYLGIEPERVHFSWVSASEGNHFASLIDKVVGEVKKIPSREKLCKRELGQQAKIT